MPLSASLTSPAGILPVRADSGSGAITGFSVSAADGSLTADGSVSGFAAGAAGLIAV